MVPVGPVQGRSTPRPAKLPVARAHRPTSQGQGLVEYGIILGLSLLVMAILLIFFDDQVAAVLHWLTNQLP
jgi:hypothetical protein